MTPSRKAPPARASKLPSLSRQRLADQIADVLREQMLIGVLKPGQAIHERETSAALGVSRTPLREALLLLEAEGLVDTSPARSPVVADPSLEELSQLLEVQGALEALAGRLACEHGSDEDLARIDALMQEMNRTDESPDTVAFFKTDMAFHEAIVAATGNQPLIKTHRQYNSRLWRARYMSSNRRLGRAQTMEDHREINAAIAKRDGESAASLMRRHLDAAITNITQVLRGEDAAE